MKQDKIMDWWKRMDVVTQSFRSLTNKNFNTKISSDVWSVAQILDHLVRVNRSYYATFDAVQSGTYKVQIHGKLGFLNRVFGKMILKSVDPERRRKIKTFPVWQPEQSHFPNNLIEVFEAEQAQMRLWMKQLAEVSRPSQPIASPANNAVIYPLAVAFEIIVTHQERHLAQAIEVAQALKSNV